MGDELSRRQAQNGVNFDFEVKFDLEGQGQSPPKTIGILTKVFYTYGPNLVILAWTGDELSRGQTWWRTDGRTDWRTDAGNDNTRRPILASGKNCGCMIFRVAYPYRKSMSIIKRVIYIYIYIEFLASYIRDPSRVYRNLPGGW